MEENISSKHSYIRLSQEAFAKSSTTDRMCSSIIIQLIANTFRAEHSLWWVVYDVQGWIETNRWQRTTNKQGIRGAGPYRPIANLLGGLRYRNTCHEWG